MAHMAMALTQVFHLSGNSKGPDNNFLVALLHVRQRKGITA
jgi:hypothetical protein